MIGTFGKRDTTSCVASRESALGRQALLSDPFHPNRRRSMKRVLVAILTVGSVVGLLAWRKAGPPSVVRWQYYMWFANGRGVGARLDSLGADGWELVTATMYSDTPTLYFKRPLP